MTRRGLIRDAAIAMLLGAVVTILVAWSLALRADTRLDSRTPALRWPASRLTGWPEQPTSLERYAVAWRGAWHLDARRIDERKNTQYQMVVARAGWPFAALQSTLLREWPGFFWSMGTGPFDNEGSFAAGFRLALHRSAPQEAGPAGWCARRLPVRPLPIGFAANTLLAASIIYPLVMLWRRQPCPLPFRPGLRRAALVVLLGFLINVGVALSLWTRWQFSDTPLQFNLNWARPGVTSEQHAARLPDQFAQWPCAVPQSWPDRPEWIGWLGTAPGVRGYEFTGDGFPAVVRVWGTMGAPNNFDPRQSVRVIQAGWPLPCLQSEELITATPPLMAAGPIWPASVTKAPAPASNSDPTPFLPVRPLALGLALNTMLFSAVAALLLYGSLSIRSLRRRMTGKCVACAYDLRSLPAGSPCPECGNAAR